MNPEELKQLLDALTQADVSEFSLKTAAFDLSLRRGQPIMPVAPAAPAPLAQAAPAPAVSQPAENPPMTGAPVKAPIVGTFYASPSPDAPPYVRVGDQVQVGQVLCIIEAMKLMNEIEAEQSGTILEICVSNAEPVEYGQTLFIIG